MLRRSFLAGVGALAVTSWPFSPLAAAGDEAVDLMPAFWRSYDANRAATSPERVAALARDLFLPQSEAYTAAGFNGAGSHDKLYNDRVRAWLERLDGMADAVRSVSDALPAAWTAHESRFRRAGLVLPADAAAYFMPSLFAFTGYSRVWRARPSLFLAPDGIVDRMGARPDLAVLIDHEAFHVYQDGAAPDLTTRALWGRLWTEGLATYASAELNPAAGLADVLMSQELAKVGPGDMADAARRAATSLDDPAAVPALFDQDRRGRLPERMGYLLGLRVVRRIAGGRSLPELARLPAAEVRTTVAKALEALTRPERVRRATGVCLT